MGKSPYSNASLNMSIEDIYPKCSIFLEAGFWENYSDSFRNKPEPEQFPDIAAQKIKDVSVPGFLPDLARIEWALYQVRSQSGPEQEKVTQISINPAIKILELEWKNLSAMFHANGEVSGTDPEIGDETLLIWLDPDTGEEYIEPAGSEDLLILKMIIESIPAEEIADSGNVPIGAVDQAVERAVQKGLVLLPETGIKRRPDFISNTSAFKDQPEKAGVFTLQWHVTQACDLHCKHCYDRSDRSNLDLDQGIRVLDDMRAFCQSRYVGGHVTFSGGNPLLYPHFTELYSSAAERGFSAAILGNPAPGEQIKTLAEISHPTFYQVSLEGLQLHNDSIRGQGHFERVISFLEVLKDLKIYSMVMLTLTKDNFRQVLPLAELLRDLTDHFTFNRLSMVGEGANLRLPSKEEYRDFLDEYMDAVRENPIMGLKDNLLNILRYERGIRTTGGCTGFGCGAAFNFLTLLPDGEVHACRKFPSMLGNIFKDSLANIYDSDLARRYRGGSSSCDSCPIKPSCGGCLASVYSHGMDIFKDRDPHCFMDNGS